MFRVRPPHQPAWPAPQRWPSRSCLGNAIQTVRRLAGKMAAVRGQNVDQNPLVLYRPSMPPLPPKSKPWKRSRSVRLAMLMHHRRARWARASPKSKTIWTIALSTFLLLLLMAISSGAVSAYSYYQGQQGRLQGLANQQIDQTTRIYDRNGQLLYVAYDNREGRRTPITFNYIPGVMQDAMIAAEDKTFWDNSGVDPQGVLRAAGQYTSSGSVQSGGSTTPPPLIKNPTNDKKETPPPKNPPTTLALSLTPPQSQLDN